LGFSCVSLPNNKFTCLATQAAVADSAATTGASAAVIAGVVAVVALVALVVVVAVVIVRRRRAAANAQPDAESNYTENSASLPEILNPAYTGSHVNHRATTMDDDWSQRRDSF